jgi:hypothetical protein
LPDFHTTNPDFGLFWKALEWKIWIYFMNIFVYFWSLGTFSLVFGIFVPRKIWQSLWTSGADNHS